MNLLDGVMTDHIFVDFELDPQFGSDQMYVDYPCRFATVGFMLMSTSFLTTLADRIRKDQGLTPLFPMDEYTDETCDGQGWYDFYYGINAVGEGYGDSTIEAIVAGSNCPDNETTYTIDLTPDEQEAMYKRIDEQCKKYLGKGCKELLAEANEKLEQEENYRTQLFAEPDEFSPANKNKETEA